MNALVGAITPALPHEPFDLAGEQLNAWRGRCLDAFVRAEAAVTETLLTLAAVPARGKTIQMPHLVGARFEALAAAIGPNGTFASEAGKAPAALHDFQEYTRIRTLLCHGVGEVMLERHGRWTVVLRSISLRTSQAERDTLLLSQDEADQLQALIARAGQILGSQLGQLRAKFVQSTA